MDYSRTDKEYLIRELLELRKQIAQDQSRDLAGRISESGLMSAIRCFDCPALEEFANVRFALDQSSTVSIADPEGRIMYVNDKFCKISKYSREELLGQDHRLLNSGYHSKEFIKDLWLTVLGGKVWKGQFRNRAKDKSFYWVDTTIVPFMDSDGKVRQFVSIRHEITALKEEIASLSPFRNYLREIDVSAGLTLVEVEKKHISLVMQMLDGNKSQAARKLGITRNTLKKKLTDCNIQPQGV